MLRRLEACPQKNFEKGSSGLYFRVIVMHAILATGPIKCYSYSYCEVDLGYAL